MADSVSVKPVRERHLRFRGRNVCRSRAVRDAPFWCSGLVRLPRGISQVENSVALSARSKRTESTRRTAGLRKAARMTNLASARGSSSHTLPQSPHESDPDGRRPLRGRHARTRPDGLPHRLFQGGEQRRPFSAGGRDTGLRQPDGARLRLPGRRSVRDVRRGAGRSARHRGHGAGAGAGDRLPARLPRARGEPGPAWLHALLPRGLGLRNLSRDRAAGADRALRRAQRGLGAPLERAYRSPWKARRWSSGPRRGST
jgi:hypothetical protein